MKRSDLTPAQRQAYDTIANADPRCTYYFDPMPTRTTTPEDATLGAATPSAQARQYRSQQVHTALLEALVELGLVAPSPSGPDTGDLIALPLDPEQVVLRCPECGATDQFVESGKRGDGDLEIWGPDNSASEDAPYGGWRCGNLSCLSYGVFGYDEFGPGDPSEGKDMPEGPALPAYPDNPPVKAYLETGALYAVLRGDHTHVRALVASLSRNEAATFRHQVSELHNHLEARLEPGTPEEGQPL